MAQIILTPIIDGTLAKASEVMGNFQAIADVVNGGLDGSNIQDGSITSAKIVDEAVISSKLAELSVGTVHISNGAVTADKLAPGAVEGASIGPGSITAEKLATDAVTEPKIKDRAVTTAKLDNLAVTGGKIAVGAVTNSKIGDFAVANYNLRDGAVDDRVLARNAVITDKIDNFAVTGPKIANEAVNNVKLASGIDAGKLTAGTLPIGRIANGAITPAKTSFMGNVSEVYVGVINSNGTAITLPPGWTVSRAAGAPVGGYRVTHNLGTTAYTVIPVVFDAPFNPPVPSYTRATNTFAIYVRRPLPPDESGPVYADAPVSFLLIRY